MQSETALLADVLAGFGHESDGLFHLLVDKSEAVAHGVLDVV